MSKVSYWILVSLTLGVLMGWPSTSQTFDIPIPCSYSGDEQPPECGRHWSSTNHLWLSWGHPGADNCYNLNQLYSPTDGRWLYVCGVDWTMGWFNLDWWWAPSVSSTSFSGIYESELGYLHLNWGVIPPYLETWGGGNTAGSGLPPVDPD